MDFLSLIIGLLLGYWLGWGRAHNCVAKECERLGAFYVGDKIYRCGGIEELSS